MPVISPMVHPSWEPWCLAFHHQSCSLLFENNHRATLKDKRHKKNRNTRLSNPDQAFRCSHCKHTCLSWIGLISYKCVCSQQGPSFSSSLFMKPSHEDIFTNHLYYKQDVIRRSIYKQNTAGLNLVFLLLDWLPKLKSLVYSTIYL